MKNRAAVFSALLRGEMPVFSFNGLDSSLLQFHGLSARSYRLLQQSGQIQKLPETFTKELLGASLYAHKMHALANAILPDLLLKLERKSFKVILLKGWAFARRYYPFPQDRAFYDIDLLFRPEARLEVEKFFLEEGYVAVQGPQKWSANEKKTEFKLATNPSVCVECHFGLGYGRYAFSDPWAGATRTDSLSVLSPEDEYLFLLFHAGVQHRFQKLVWLMDLAQMKRHFENRASPAWNWERVAGRAKKAGMGAALAFSEYLLNDDSSSRSRRFDRYFEWIASGSVEESFWKKSTLRAFFQGGWLSLGRYGFESRILNW